MRAHRRMIAVTGSLALLVGCTAPRIPVADTVDEAVAVSVPPTMPVVLDPVPTGARVQQVVATWTAQPSEDYDPLSSGATLYGDARAEDPLDEPLLLIGSSSGSASIGGPNSQVPGAHPVDLPADEGQWIFVPAGGRSWVVHAGLNDAVAYVVGQGVTEAELVAAARSADFLGSPPTIAPAALPAGFAPLAAGVPGDGPRPWSAESLRLVVDDVLIEVSAVEADRRLALLWGFWAVGDGEPLDTGLAAELGDGASLLRAGPMPDTIVGNEVYGVVWADDDNVVSVVGTEWGLGERSAADLAPAVESVAADVRAGTADELAVLADRVLDPPTPADLYCPPGASMISGRTGDVRWSYAVGLDPEWGGLLHECTGVTNPEDGLNTQDRIWGEDEPLPAVGQILAGPANAIAGLDPSEHDGVLRTGVAPAGTARVVVVSQSGEEVEALVGGQGPRAGERLFAAYFPGRDAIDPFTQSAYGASAYDADGRGLDFQILP